jgi:hypothetical protein
MSPEKASMSAPVHAVVMPLWCHELMAELKRKRASFRKLAASDYYDDSTEQKRREKTMWRFEADGIDAAIKELRKVLKREYGKSA